MAVAIGVGFEVVDLEGRPAQPVQDALEIQYGVDLRYPGDLVVRGSGDLERTRGIEAFKSAFARALITSPGELFWRPDYGIGATEFLNRPINKATILDLKNRIRRSAQSEAAVERVDELEVSYSPTSELLEVRVRVLIAGVSAHFALGVRRT